MTETAPETRAAGNTLSIIGIVCGVLSLMFVPIILGPLGIVLGVVARKRGEKLGVIAITVAAVGMVLGFVIGALIYNQLYA